MSDLYMVLGVPRDAELGEIKRAYRKWQKANHPDANNGAKHVDHEAVQQAYEVLSDPQRRKVYDESGEIVDVEEQARGWLLGAFARALRQIDVERTDLAAFISGLRNAEEREGKRERLELSKGKQRLLRLKARLRAKGRAEFLLTAMDDAELVIDRQIAGIDSGLEVLTEVAGILEDFSVEQIAGIGSGKVGGSGSGPWGASW